MARRDIPPGANLHEDRLHPPVQPRVPRQQQREESAGDQPRGGARQRHAPGPQDLRRGRRREHQAQGKTKHDCGGERHADARNADQYAIAAHDAGGLQLDLAGKRKSHAAAQVSVGGAASTAGVFVRRANGAMVAPQGDPARLGC